MSRKIGATHLGEIISCTSANSSLNDETSAPQSWAQVENFELIVPYIEQLNKQNSGTEIGYQRDDDNHVADIMTFLDS